MKRAIKVSIHHKNEEGKARWDRNISNCIETAHPRVRGRANIRKRREEWEIDRKNHKRSKREDCREGEIKLVTLFLGLNNIPFYVVFTFMFFVLVQISHCGLLSTHNTN